MHSQDRDGEGGEEAGLSGTCEKETLSSVSRRDVSAVRVVGRHIGGLIMMKRQELDFWACASEMLNRMRSGGVLCTVTDKAGRQNLLTLSWGQIGPFYHEHPVFIIAVSALRYSWRFLEEVPEFVIAVPDDALRSAADLCGTKSGRDLDKFKAAGLTPVPSMHVQPPSIAECPINVECRIYTTVAPPHMLLTPEHRQHPIEEQHTIFFAEVLGTYGGR